MFRAFAFFREMFDEAAKRHPDVKADRLYVDACSLMMVKRPWDFDVMVTENMFGDILSDLAAGLIGGLGMAPSADIGDRYAVFQPCHGTAPDIMGQGKANPTAMILSAAMMLDWLADKHGLESAAEAGERIERAVDKAYAGGNQADGIRRQQRHRGYYESGDRGVVARHVKERVLIVAMCVGSHRRHTPRRRGIQYAAASRFNHWRLWNTGSSAPCAIAHKADDDRGE